MTNTTLDDLDIAIAHDQLWEFGGAERVALRIGETLDAPVVTTAAGPEARSEAADRGVELRTFADEKYDRFGVFTRSGLKELSLVFDWQTAPLREFDIVVSSGWASRQYRTTDGQYLLNYCHSPYRPANDLLADTLERLSTPARAVARLYLTAIDLLDGRAADRVDAFLANSDLVRERIRRYYRREATVVYPPVDLPEVSRSDGSEPYFLFIGRLVPEKRPETVLEAFAESGRPLKVVGASTGSIGSGDIGHDAPSNVEFLGTVSEQRKIDLLRRATGVVYVPVREDFGLVPIEALAVGTPVVTVAEGFPGRVIEDGRTGVVVEPTVEGVAAGVERLADATFDRGTLRAAAAPFAADRFETRLREAVETFANAPEAYQLADEPLLQDSDDVEADDDSSPEGTEDEHGH
ncbi:glycosyltransferase [Halapricum hydrolyticum]|uniref:GDP-Man:Man(1)GlcNAc(2)-PP-Dol alpha-1,3-mannosyltransferase n=1 Tax=Halapricum hydrolyticum TaxID=2979991 RepID=A0AAE3LIJ2_9EURY|nr:glycosyltransferase [Halapricum hydrolyticum]MCU4718211.1 glycosyltransferase [Halapricum hydrolyticum]MCU4726348.1 glycosyltransferase [Halapricum hydrolyticum]